MTMSSRPLSILISGAGIAGPTLAWFLAKAGARITVVEKSADLLPHGQNVDLQGSARTVIEKMGLMEQVRRANTTEKGTQFIDPEGRAFAPFALKAGSAASFTSDLEILRADLATILYRASQHDPNVTTLFGTTVSQVLSNNETGVEVELSDGSVRGFDLVVAADGQWSKLRASCFEAESVEVVDMGMYAVYGTIPRQPQDNDWWNVYQALDSRIITLRPDPHGTTRAMLTRMPRDEAHKKAWAEAARSDRPTRERFLRREFADAGWQTQRLLDGMAEAPDFFFQAIQQIKMRHWSRGRVVCLGDAAYAPSPLTGMGTSLAITGAYVLACELEKLGEGEHPARALSAYERAFRPYVEKSQEIPRFVPGIAHPRTAWTRWLFRTAVQTLSSVVARPWVARRLVHGHVDDYPLP